jgi:retinol dehydrogenase 14
VVITGGTRGIGLEAARALSTAGAELVIVSRDPKRTAETAKTISAETGNPVHAVIADFAELAQVRRAAEEILSAYGSIDVLVNNAGAIYPARQTTVDGFEMTWQVDYLGPFLFTWLLKPALLGGDRPRVISVSSDAHQGAWRGLNFEDLNGARSWSSFGAYSAAKLANIMFSAELARRWGPGITSNAMHPGRVQTGFGRSDDWHKRRNWSFTSRWSLTPAEGADTLVYLASSPEAEGVTGKYFYKRAPKKPSRPARDERSQLRLWLETIDLLGLEPPDSEE